ncbi:hypothetical protein DL93DRAFT_1599253 [Clavulina sp. PMI_390]|nr:hypothetical protein DL93DRAFT_1599253 [Clavulina sp. PMI_390]
MIPALQIFFANPPVIRFTLASQTSWLHASLLASPSSSPGRSMDGDKLGCFSVLSYSFAQLALHITDDRRRLILILAMSSTDNIIHCCFLLLRPQPSLTLCVHRLKRIRREKNKNKNHHDYYCCLPLSSYPFFIILYYRQSAVSFNEFPPRDLSRLRVPPSPNKTLYLSIAASCRTR